MRENYRNGQNVYQARYVTGLQNLGYNVNTNGYPQPAVGYHGQPALQQSPQGYTQPYPINRYGGWSSSGNRMVVPQRGNTFYNQNIRFTQVCVFFYTCFRLTSFFGIRLQRRSPMRYPEMNPEVKLIDQYSIKL